MSASSRKKFSRIGDFNSFVGEQKTQAEGSSPFSGVGPSPFRKQRTSITRNDSTYLFTEIQKRYCESLAAGTNIKKVLLSKISSRNLNCSEATITTVYRSWFKSLSEVNRQIRVATADSRIGENGFLLSDYLFITSNEDSTNREKTLHFNATLRRVQRVKEKTMNFNKLRILNNPSLETTSKIGYGIPEGEFSQCMIVSPQSRQASFT